jgi:hypothetical protein
LDYDDGVEFFHSGKYHLYPWRGGEGSLSYRTRNQSLTFHDFCLRYGTSTCGKIIASWTDHQKSLLLVSINGSRSIEYGRVSSYYFVPTAEHFDAIGNGQWQWLIIVAVFTFCPSVVFVLIELFRETKADGSNTAKSNTEVVIEGVCFLTLVLAWIPTVLIATTPRGAASLIGNAYFFTWIMTIFVFEGFIWYIHDKRKETHYALKEKEDEYHQRQRKVLEQTRAIQRKHEEGEDEMEFSRRPSTEFFDPVENLPESRARFAS